MTTLAALTAEFFTARLPRKHSPNTLAAYEHDLALVTAHLATHHTVEPAELTITHLDVPALRAAFAGVSHLAPASIARAWSTWNQLLTFAVAEGHLPGNPMAAVAKPKLPRSRPKAIQGDDAIPRILAAASVGRLDARDPWRERDYAVMAVFLCCGLRLAELCDLRVQSIDGPEHDRVLAVRGKGSKERTVPVEPVVDRIISQYLESRRHRHGRWPTSAALFVDNRGDAIQRGGVQYLVKRLYRQAGLTAQVPAGASVHALRHTFATAVARAGASGTELQRLLGHESLATTQRYVDATGREVRAAASRSEAYAALASLDGSRIEATPTTGEQT